MAELKAKRGIDTGSSLENLGHHTRAVCLLRDYRQGDRDYDGRGRRQDGVTHRVAAVEHGLECVLRNSGGRYVLRAAVGEGRRGYKSRACSINCLRQSELGSTSGFGLENLSSRALP